MIKIHLIIRDLKNYYDLRKIIKKEAQNSPVWSKNNLRYDWIGRIYTVVNLPPEVTKSPDLPKEAWVGYALEDSKPINEYLTSLNLQEIIVPEYTQIPDTESVLIVYRPYFRELGWSWVLTRSGFWLTIFFLEHRWSLFSNVWSWIDGYLKGTGG